MHSTEAMVTLPYFRSMLNAARRFIFQGILLLPIAVHGQNMTLAGGTLTVSSGTRIALDGPIVWSIAPGASLINDGRIELGTMGSMDEPDGNPVTGTGTEHAAFMTPGPVSDMEPGGLGLSLSSANGLGDMELVRGHTIQLDGTSTESIARWFQLIGTASPGIPVGIRFHYDPVELNGHLESELILHSGDELIGPWTALAGTPDLPNHDIISAWDFPWGFITAFDEDITTDVPGGSDPEFMIWPTITDDVVHIRSRAGAAIRTVNVMDATGRMVDRLAATPDGISFSVASYPAGVYLLLVNNTRTFRIVRP